VPILALFALLFPWLTLVGPGAQPETAGATPFGAGHAPRGQSCSVDPLQSQGTGTAVETLIAAVPDPLQTRLGYEFDRFVEAIERGVESSGYTLDCFELPWLAWGSGDVASVESRIQRGEQQPGRILFRGKDATKPSFLEVFLVGEMPTRGMHTQALSEALRRAKERCLPTTGCTEMRILGPAFSGSVLSLRTALQGSLREELSCARPRVRVVSGSATSVRREDLGLAESDSFEATVYPDERVLTAFIQSPSLLPGGLDQDPSSRRIAVLVEGNTGYGRAIKDAIKGGPSIVAVPFPLHISSVRQAYERRKAEAKKGTEGNPLADQTLPLLSEKSDAARDVLPPFSELDTNSVELILSRILTTIGRERIEYVGVFATDVKDRLFLAEEVLAHCTNASVFTFDSDLLYGRSDALDGMLVYSAYPLFAMNQRWSYPFTASMRLQFVSGNAQGVYNATVALLQGQDAPSSDGLLEYGEPFDRPLEHKPPLWLSVVGRNGLWPVRYLSGLDSGGYLHLGRSQSPPPAPTTSDRDLAGVYSKVTLCTGVIGAVAGGLVLLMMLRPLGMRPRLLRAFTTLFPTFDFEAGLEAEAWLSLFGCSAAAMILSGLLASIFLVPVRAARELHLELEWLAPGIACLFLVLFLGLMTTTLMAWRGLLRAGRAGPRTALGARVVSLVFLALVGLGTWFAVGLHYRPTGEAFFFFMRAVDLGNGVSPLAPLLLLGVSNFFWSFSALRRVRLNADLQDVPILPSTEEGSLWSFDALEVIVRDHLTAPAFRVPGSGLVVLLTLTFLWLFWYSVRSLDGGPFHRLAGFWFVLLYVSIALTFLRSVVIWSGTQRILKRLSFHPLADAFSRLPPRLSWTPMMGLVRRVPTFTDIEASVRYARSLLGPGPESDALGSSLHEGLASEIRGDREGASRHKREVRSELNRLAGEVARQLEPHWSRRGLQAAPENDRVALAEEFLASRVVAFLRHVFAQLRNLLLFVSFGLILLLGASTSYPFQPRQLLLTFQWIAVLSVVSVILAIFVQMDRDRVLSDIARTPPGRLTWSREFVTRLITFVVLPILGLASAQFPGAGAHIGTWLRMLAGAH
jgi:hypothetical protein